MSVRPRTRSHVANMTCCQILTERFANHTLQDILLDKPTRKRCKKSDMMLPPDIVIILSLPGDLWNIVVQFIFPPFAPQLDKLTSFIKDNWTMVSRKNIDGESRPFLPILNEFFTYAVKNCFQLWEALRFPTVRRWSAWVLLFVTGDPSDNPNGVRFDHSPLGDNCDSCLQLAMNQFRLEVDLLIFYLKMNWRSSSVGDGSWFRSPYNQDEVQIWENVLSLGDKFVVDEGCVNRAYRSALEILCIWENK